MIAVQRDWSTWFTCATLLVCVSITCNQVQGRTIHAPQADSDEFYEYKSDESNSNEDFHFDPSPNSQEPPPKSSDYSSFESTEQLPSVAHPSMGNASFAELCKNVRCNAGTFCRQTTASQVDCVIIAHPVRNVSHVDQQPINRYLSFTSGSSSNHHNADKKVRIEQRTNKLIQTLKQTPNASIKYGQTVHPSSVFTCSVDQQLQTGSRLFDWLTLLWIQRGRPGTSGWHSEHNECAQHLRWMFAYLDTDRNHRLALAELYDNQSPQSVSDPLQAKSQFCVRAFINTCDLNLDKHLDSDEWCACFDHFQPCAAERRRLRSLVKGRSVMLTKPQCDTNGKYQSLQCDMISGHCWCVNAQGHPITQPTLGLIECDKNQSSSEQSADVDRSPEQDDDAESDDEDDDQEHNSDSDEEGSGDLMIPV